MTWHAIACKSNNPINIDGVPMDRSQENTGLLKNKWIKKPLGFISIIKTVNYLPEHDGFQKAARKSWPGSKVPIWKWIKKNPSTIFKPVQVQLSH